MFLGVQVLLCKHFHKVKLNGRFWPNARVHLAEWRPQNLATLTARGEGGGGEGERGRIGELDRLHFSSSSTATSPKIQRKKKRKEKKEWTKFSLTSSTNRPKKEGEKEARKRGFLIFIFSANPKSILIPIWIHLGRRH
jgi:hypothetical protein